MNVALGKTSKIMIVQLCITLYVTFTAHIVDYHKSRIH